MLRQFLASRFAGVRQLAGEVVDGLDDRARLFSVEMAAEQDRLLRLVIVALGALVVTVLAVVWAAATVVAFAWDTEWRTIALVGLLVFWIALAAGLCLWARSLMSASRHAFPLTRRVAEEDLRRMREMLE